MEPILLQLRRTPRVLIKEPYKEVLYIIVKGFKYEACDRTLFGSIWKLEPFFMRVSHKQRFFNKVTIQHTTHCMTSITQVFRTAIGRELWNGWTTKTQRILLPTTFHITQSQKRLTNKLLLNWMRRPTRKAVGLHH